MTASSGLLIVALVLLCTTIMAWPSNLTTRWSVTACVLAAASNLFQEPTVATLVFLIGWTFAACAVTVHRTGRQG